MKNVVISLCVILSLIYSVSAVENNNQKINSELTDYERNIIKYEKELRRLVDGNWKQKELFKREDLSCCFNINLNNSADEYSLLSPQFTIYEFLSECKKININKGKKIN